MKKSLFTMVASILVFACTVSGSFASVTGFNAGYEKINVYIDPANNLNQFNIDFTVLKKDSIDKIEKMTKLKALDKGTPMLVIQVYASVAPDGSYGVITMSNVLMNGNTEYISKNGLVCVDYKALVKVVQKSMVKETIYDDVNKLVNYFIQSYNEDSEKYKN